MTFIDPEVLYKCNLCFCFDLFSFIIIFLAFFVALPISRIEVDDINAKERWAREALIIQSFFLCFIKIFILLNIYFIYFMLFNFFFFFGEGDYYISIYQC